MSSKNSRPTWSASAVVLASPRWSAGRSAAPGRRVDEVRPEQLRLRRSIHASPRTKSSRSCSSPSSRTRVDVAVHERGGGAGRVGRGDDGLAHRGHELGPARRSGTPGVQPGSAGHGRGRVRVRVRHGGPSARAQAGEVQRHRRPASGQRAQQLAAVRVALMRYPPSSPSLRSTSAGGPSHTDGRLPTYSEVLDAHLAAPEARGGEVAEGVEEGGPVPHRDAAVLVPGARPSSAPSRYAMSSSSAVRSRLRAGHEVAGRSARGTRRRSRPGRRAWTSGAALARALLGRVRHHEVHELGHARVGGAARALVARDDEVDQHAHRLPLVGGEELRACRRCALGGGRHAPAPRAACAGAASAAAQAEAHREGRGADQAQARNVGRARSSEVPLAAARRRCARSVRMDRARIVHVMFLCALVTNGPLSATNRFLHVVRLAPLVEHRRARARRPCGWCRPRG